MSNPIFKALGGGMPGNMAEMVKQFNQFKQTFNGDPKQQIQEMLNSGKISQADYDKAVQMANQFMKMMK